MAMYYERSADHRKEILKLFAFLLRYGPKSINELMGHPSSFLLELSEEIGNIMQDEKKAFDVNTMTGDS